MTEPYYDRHGVTVLAGDCLDRLAELDDDSVDAVVCDPPYGLAEHKPAALIAALTAWVNGDRASVPDGHGFMGRAWDAFVPPPAAWDECLRVLKPGGHLVAFAGSRTVDVMGLSIRLAGFEIRDGLAWLYGSGFPKSLDVAKAIDRQRTEDVDVVLAVADWLCVAIDAGPVRRRDVAAHFGVNPRLVDLWAPRPTDKAARKRAHVPSWDTWQQLRNLVGFGDDMDAEVWRLNGRKGTPGEAWARREVIGQGHRVRRASDVDIAGPSTGAYDLTAAATDAARKWQGWGTALKPAHEPIVLARKPLAGTVATNVQTHGTGALNIDGCRAGSAERTNSAGGASSLQRVSRVEQGYRDHVTASVGEPSAVNGRWPSNVLLTHAARCDDPAEGCNPAWCPVAELDQQSGTLTSGANPTRRGSDKFRNAYGDFAGQAECTPARGADSGGASRFFPTFRWESKAPTSERPQVDGVAHPTVKPVDLMRWLVRLVTPPGGLVLDPFAGSGTTGQAARAEGMRAVLIERDPTYLPLIKARLDARPRTAAATAAPVDDGPMDLLDLLGDVS